MRDCSPLLPAQVAALGNVCRQLHIHVTGRRRSDAAWPQPVSAPPNALALETCAGAVASKVSRDYKSRGLQMQMQMQMASALHASETCMAACNIPAAHLCLPLPCSVTALEKRSRTARRSFSSFWKC